MVQYRRQTRKSLSFPAKGACPEGFHKRKAYTSRRGHRVGPRCIRSQSPYLESSANFKRRTIRKMQSRLHGLSRKSLGLTKKCPKGYILRAPYKRRFRNTVRREGYLRRVSGKTVRVRPQKESTIVEATCVKDRGLPGKQVIGMGPLRKGELIQFGYSFRLPAEARRKALQKAVKKFGPLGVFRKLDAVAKLSTRTVPQASRVFSEDRDWVRSTYILKAL
jgi:hypothetical protein